MWWVMEKSFSWSSMKPSTIINHIKAYSRQWVHPHHQNHLKEPRKFWDNMWRTNKKEMLGREYGERKKFFRTHWMVLYGADNDLNRAQQAHKEGFFFPRPVECFLFPNPNKLAFCLLKTNLKGQRPKNVLELSTATVDVWQSSTRT